MTRTVANRMCSVIAVVAIAAPGALGASGVSPAGATGGPTITVTPDSGLVDGQMVTVTGEGFEPWELYEIFECRATAVDDELCDGYNAYMFDSDGEGRISFAFPVDARILSRWGEEFDCRSAPGACTIGVGYMIDYDESAVAPLTFDPDAPLLPRVRAELSRRAGLADGDVITVTGRNVSLMEAAWVWQCQTAVQPGLCDYTRAKSIDPDGDRRFRSRFRVRSMLRATSGETIDCAAGPGVCAVGVSWGYAQSADRYDEVPISFGSDPAAPRTGDPGSGYRLAGTNGRAYSFGLPTTRPRDLSPVPPIVDVETTPSGHGYWMASSDGGVFSFFDAKFRGSAGGIALRAPVVGMAATPTGRGYWLAASDGGVFTFGDARFRGSAGSLALRSPIVGMAATPSGRGYWLAASDGGVFSFGDARFYGSLGALVLAEPIVGVDATPSGRGYWLVASDGGVFAFGDARFAGSLGGLDLAEPIVGLAATPSGRGYRLAASDGGVFAFGDGGYIGGMSATDLGGEIVAIG